MDDNPAMLQFERLESNVRSYSRTFPAVFSRAQGCRLVDEEGKEYLDFFSGAGALNYGHNPPRLKRRLIEYIQDDGVIQSLDMATTAKRRFLERFHDIILEPRGLDYKVQFPGPTGTNAVEAALKLARKYTRRRDILYFTGSFHGMTLGSLSVTSNPARRQAAGVPLGHTTPMPFDGCLGRERDTLEHLAAYLEAGPAGGSEPPAAVILETVQAEGGVNVARDGWLKRLATLLRRHQVPLIVDDIQVGCGRTGSFFSFEPAGIVPDIVCLSKSISGYGLAMALVLVRPELDVWAPGEHNGTFRGNNLAFVTAKAAIDHFWSDDTFANEIKRKGDYIRQRLEAIVKQYGEGNFTTRGRGMFRGINCVNGELAEKITRKAFRNGLVIETSGADDQVIKFLVPLIISDESLQQGIDIVERAIKEVCEEEGRIPKERDFYVVRKVAG